MQRKDKRDSTDLYFSGTTGRKVQNVRRIINSNLEQEISIEELSEKVNLNRTTLQKVFKEMYGLTINEYRTKSRIQLAKNLLASTNLSVTEIAGRCGYINASKFSEVFKRNEGILPKNWRE
jgi:transcriptional regulator GlxA family with amidase domain